MRASREVLIIASLFLAISSTAAAQSAATQSTRFEVATIKPVLSGTPQMVGTTVHPGGRVEIGAVSLRSLVAIAFNLSFWQISGGDPWTDKDRYTIEAKPPESWQSHKFNLGHSWYTIEDENLRQMLQTLLIERFQLKFHRDTKAGKVYLLEKSGKKLALGQADSGSSKSNYAAGLGTVGWAGRWVIFNTSMPQLAKFTSDNILHCPVWDRTGLAGAFNYESPNYEERPAADNDQAAFAEWHNESFARLMDEVGLKLKSDKGPVEAFVIDNAEKPSEN